MATDSSAVPTPGALRVEELLVDNEHLRLEVARLEGRIVALQEQLGAQDAADEHHRVELEAARIEAADAQAALKGAQVRVEEWRGTVAEARERLTIAERQRDQAEQERAAVIAALGRRARKHLDDLGST